MAEAGIRLEAFASVTGCPFSGPLYRLVRQQLLAAYLVSTGMVELAGAVVLSFWGHDSLRQLPAPLAPLLGKTIIDTWNRVLAEATLVRHLTAETLMVALDGTGRPDEVWRKYVRERYGV